MKALPVARALILAGFAVCLAAPAHAQAPAPPDFTKVEIQTSELAPNVYRFEAVGPALVGNAGMLTGPDGIFMVDAQFAQLTDKLMAAIKAVSDGRIRFLVNTHHHPDHTSGDANFAKMGVAILSRDELRAHLAAGNNPPPPEALPRDRASALITQGKSQEEVIAAKPLADLDARVQQAGTTGDRFLGQVYADLKAGK